jgi:hypothetical protein
MRTLLIAEFNGISFSDSSHLYNQREKMQRNFLPATSTGNVLFVLNNKLSLLYFGTSRMLQSFELLHFASLYYFFSLGLA